MPPIIHNILNIMENNTSENKKQYAVGERTISAIIADLSKRLPDRFISTKRQGGTNIKFISWFHRVKMLDFYAPGWENEIKRIDNIGGKLIITVALTIKASDGVFAREATGQESEEKDTFGDSSSNAEAMALSRASAKFGLGLYLYSEK